MTHELVRVQEAVKSIEGRIGEEINWRGPLLTDYEVLNIVLERRKIWHFDLNSTTHGDIILVIPYRQTPGTAEFLFSRAGKLLGVRPGKN